jgi:hypothetical protein
LPDEDDEWAPLPKTKRVKNDTDEDEMVQMIPDKKKDKAKKKKPVPEQKYTP